MLEYFYREQSEQFTFYRIPKALFTDDRFKEISSDAKLLYGLLLDRMSLSAKNGWCDDQGRVFIIYTIEEVREAINCADKKATGLMRELDEGCGLIERRRQGQGKPNLIYVKNFIGEGQKVQVKNRQNHDSRDVDNTNQESSESRCNNTKINNTDLNDIDSIHSRESKEEKYEYADIMSYFKALIDYDALLYDLPLKKQIIDDILEIIVETFCTTKEYIRVCGEDKPAEVVRSRLEKLNIEHIKFVIKCMEENTTKILNIRQYLLATVYNAPITISSYYSSLVSHDMSHSTW